MKKVKLTGYVEGEESLRTLVETGYGKVLVESPRYSLLCLLNESRKDEYEEIKRLFELGKELDPQLEIVFNLDIIPHENELPDIERLIHGLLKIGYDGIRVQDMGVATIIRDMTPELKFEINSYTGNNNPEAVLFLEKAMGPGLSGITLSKEIDIRDLTEICHRMSVRAEIMVHGPILLFHSRRRLLKLSDFSGESYVEKDNYALWLKESKRPDDWFLFRDSAHGSFMFFCHELCLIKHVRELMELGPDYWLVDMRGKSGDVLKIVTEKYFGRMEDALSGDYHESEGNRLYDEIEKLYPQGLTEGFFLENTTDSRVRSAGEDLGDCVGRVISVVKEKVMAVEILGDLRAGEELIVRTPEGKCLNYCASEIRTLEGQDVRELFVDHVYLFNWRKGLTAKCLIFKKDRLGNCVLS
ncbi:MAG: U32 family peptidase [Spirochaetota bacterium]|nr:U32 family peptidase [Spirochaetota bacterium]